MDASQTKCATMQIPAKASIRSATLHDLPLILEFSEKFHKQANQPFPFNREASEQFASALIANDNAEVFISDHGMIGGILTPSPFSSRWVMAVELAWWAEKGGIKLLKTFEDWARKKGANEVRMTSLATLDRADTLLKRLSYTPVEVSYRKTRQNK